MARHSNGNQGWFDIDDTGFIRQQAGRDPMEIVRELVQNAFDAVGATLITILIRYVDRVVTVEIEDDGEGFDDPAQAFTVFLSGKFDDPTKRGRKGRGLKEAIAASRSATVELVGRTTMFGRRGRAFTRQTRRNARASGTRVELRVRGWRKRDVDAVCQELIRFEPPNGVDVRINGTSLERHDVVALVPVSLQTLIIDDGVERRRTRDTEVALLGPRPGETPHIMELGIPVCEVDTPWHLDVQQRIPLPDHRSTVPPGWLMKLRAQVLDHMATEMTPSQLKDDWVAGALSSVEEATKEAYVEKVFGKKIAIRSPGDADANTRAAEDLHLKVIDTRHLPKGVRETLRDRAPSSVKAVRDAVQKERELPFEDKQIVESNQEKAVCRLAAWMASETTGRRVNAQIDFEVRLSTGRPGMARWSPDNNTITFSRKVCTRRFFADPFAPQVLSVIIHEIAHIGQESYGHGQEFGRRMEEVAGEVAWLLLDQGEEARKVARA